VCDGARNREEFLVQLRQGRVRVEGEQGCYLTLTRDILRLTARLYVAKVKDVIEQPLNWRRDLMIVCLSIGLPLATVGILGSLVHYVQDERYNRSLLLDLLEQSAEQTLPSEPQVVEVAV